MAKVERRGGKTGHVSRANSATTELLRHYYLLVLIGENRLYPTNRQAMAAFRQDTGKATTETSTVG